RHPRSTIFPYTTLFRSVLEPAKGSNTTSFSSVKNLMKNSAKLFGNLAGCGLIPFSLHFLWYWPFEFVFASSNKFGGIAPPLSLRSEEHTSELQSRENLV